MYSQLMGDKHEKKKPSCKLNLPHQEQHQTHRGNMHLKHLENWALFLKGRLALIQG